MIVDVRWIDLFGECMEYIKTPGLIKRKNLILVMFATDPVETDGVCVYNRNNNVNAECRCWWFFRKDGIEQCRAEALQRAAAVPTIYDFPYVYYVWDGKIEAVVRD